MGRKNDKTIHLMLKICQKSVTICPIFDQIFPVLNEKFTKQKNLVFGHCLYQFDSK
jgi:hypothetical protein